MKSIEEPLPTTLHPDAEIINYIRKKCVLPPEEIEKKLLNGETFDIKAEGNDLDTKLMEEVLKENDFFEKATQKIMKDDTMKFLKAVIENWSRDIARTQMRINEGQLDNYTAKLLPFGSYVLDLRSNTSDIDLICVCPSFINRDNHFFVDLVKKLEESEEVRNLSTRPNAKVPIITFIFKEIDVDISFCQLPAETVPSDIEKVIKAELLNTIIDEKSKISLLGRKNNLMIMELTGKQIQNFKQTLRLVKVWAKNRGISSNGMGYLGGISWAILVAKVCQIFPNHKPSKLLAEFFIIYSIWNWKSMPVCIMPEPLEKYERAMMKVVTPGSAYNSTERVNEITFKVIVEELKRANTILMSRKDLNELCKKNDFFGTFPLFIQIDICGENNSKDDEKIYKDFQGNVESKILKLLQNIIKYHKKNIEDGTLKVVPNPRLYKKQDKVYPLCFSCFFGLEFQLGMEISMIRSVRQWCDVIDMARGGKKTLNLRVFEGTKDDFNDVEINDNRKKKNDTFFDPRLVNREPKKNTAEFFKSHFK